MLKCDYKYVILLDKWGRFNFFLNSETLYSGGWGKSPLLLDIFVSHKQYIHKVILFYCRMTLHTSNV